MADENGTKLCTNCKRQIAAANFLMHEVHCKRHISVCSHCQEPIPKAEMEIHFEDTHAKINCTKCNEPVEKSLIEKHEEEDCPKRPAKCAYCELEMPRNELEQHQGYCGTRTEPCLKCGQFIMIKDINKHEDSNCTYPAPKPTNGNESSSRTLTNGSGSRRNIGASGAENYDDQLFGYGEENVVDPFTFDEIQRMLNKPELSGASGVDPESRVQQRVLPNVPPSRTKKNIDKNKSNKKSDINRLRERQVENGGSAAYNEEHDRLLAMHLSEDLHQDGDLGEYMQAIDKPRSATTRGSSRGPDNSPVFYDNSRNVHSSSLGDILLLPCEFCGQAVPIDDLVMHQTHCVEDPFSSLHPSQQALPHTAASTTSSFGLDYEFEDNRYRGLAPESRQPPPIINNLVPESSTHQDSWTEQLLADEDMEDFVLPCEFCEELFPQDMLVQHQAVCESNGGKTPRLSSASRRKKSEDSMITPRTRKHQQAPDISSILGRENNTSRRSTMSASGRNLNNDLTPSQRINTTLSKYGITAENPYQQRMERRALRTQHSAESDEENSSPRPRTGQRSKRGVNTKNTLENLLRGVDTPPHDLLGHMNMTSSKKNNKDNVNSYRQERHSVNQTSSRKVVGAQGLSSNSYGAKKESPSLRMARGSVNARDVQNELENSGSRGSSVNMPTGTRKTRPPVTRPVRPDLGLSTSSMTPGTRQRERGNNIFGGHSRGETTPTRTSTSNRNPSTRRNTDFNY